MTKAKPPSPLTFKVKPEERAAICAAAELAEMAVSSYIRSRLLDTPLTAAMYRRSETRRLIMQLIGHIGRVGNNLNQIARKLNSDQALERIDCQQHEEGVRALQEMRAILIDHLLRQGLPC